MKINEPKSLTIDVEEYFQVEAFSSDITIKEWDSYPSRIDFQINKLLNLLEKNETKATFFILGIVAEKNPDIIKKISSQGHEIASHGFNHQHITKQNQKEFRSDITMAKETLEQIISKEVAGYRAPCFSITPSNHWAHDEIKSAGYLYSSSTYPISHDLYGVPKAPRTPYFLSNGLLEIPISTASFKNKIFPAGGGGYFRLLPFFIFNKVIEYSRKELNFINFYTHPWEYDPNQPKIKSSLKSNFRHHINQNSALSKLEKLCHKYQFETLAKSHLGKNYPTLGAWENISIGQNK